MLRRWIRLWSNESVNGDIEGVEEVSAGIAALANSNSKVVECGA